MNNSIEQLRALAQQRAEDKRANETETEKRFREWRERLRKQGKPVLGG